VGLSWPLTTPLEALAADAFTLDLPFETVTLDEFVSGAAIVVGTLGLDTCVRDVACATWCAIVVTFRCEIGLVVVVAGAVVVGGDEVLVRGGVSAGGTLRESRWRGGVELDEAVKVKTRTKRRTGLDHITQ
jgi:hypothetical protein